MSEAQAADSSADRQNRTLARHEAPKPPASLSHLRLHISSNLAATHHNPTTMDVDKYAKSGCCQLLLPPCLSQFRALTQGLFVKVVEVSNEALVQAGLLGDGESFCSSVLMLISH